MTTSQDAFDRANLLAGELGRPQEALGVLEQAIASDPHNSRLWTLRAWVYERVRDWPLAVEAAKIAAAHNPQNAWAFRIMSNGYRRRGWYDQSVETAREAVRLEPHHPYCHTTLGQALCMNISTWREGSRAIQRALELAPNDPGVLTAAGSAALARKRPGLAERYFNQALAIVPDNAAIRNDLALAHSRKFQLRTAIFGYTEALATNPSQQLSYTNIVAALCRAVFVTYAAVLGCSIFAAYVNPRIPIILLFILLAAWEIRGHARQMIKITVPAAEQRGGLLPILVFGMPIAIAVLLVVPLFPPDTGRGIAKATATLAGYVMFALIVGFIKGKAKAR
jgi:Flp pilus assembly protein TadD